MDPVLIVYATREGHTHRIAKHIAEILEADGYASVVADAANLEGPADFGDIRCVILAASVHADHHEDEMVGFVRRYRESLARRHTAFISVSLTEATAEDPRRSRKEREEAGWTARQMIEGFFEETGWRAERSYPVAGALLYSRYGRAMRWMMARIARNAGADTDTSHDYVYTDWDALDSFALEFVHKADPTESNSLTEPA